MSLRNRTRLSLIVAASASLILGVFGSPAQAHYTQAFHGDDVATLLDGHRNLTADDNECDNNGVYAYARLIDGSFITVNDPDGCSSQVGNTYAATQVDWYYVCERNVGCSPTKDA